MKIDQIQNLCVYFSIDLEIRIRSVNADERKTEFLFRNSVLPTALNNFLAFPPVRKHFERRLLGRAECTHSSAAAPTEFPIT